MIKKVTIDNEEKYYRRLFTKIKREWSFFSPVKKRLALINREKTSHGFKWFCNHCKKLYAWSEIDFDHMEPIALSTPKNLTELLYCVEKQNCPIENLQILCKSCHKVKTNQDKQKQIKDKSITYILEYFNKIGIKSINNYYCFKLECLSIKSLSSIYKVVFNIQNLSGTKQEKSRKKLGEILKNL